MVYQILFYGGLAGAIVTLVLSILIFIRLQIHIVLEDLFGIRFAKFIGGKRNHGSQREKVITSEIVSRKKAVTDTALAPTSQLTSAPPSKMMKETMLLQAAARIDETSLIENTRGNSPLEETTLMEPTALLAQTIDEETTLLDNEPLTEETTLLHMETAETTLLFAEEDPFFIKEVDIIVIHTDQVI